MRRALPLFAAAGLAISACSSGDSDEDVSADQTTTSEVGDAFDHTGDPPTPSTTASTEPATTPDAAADESGDVEELFPDVIDATASRSDDGTWTISATLSSPYDTPERYADAWQVLGPDGTQYGERFLTHDHANEQPFTRSESGIEIPDDVDVVTIQGRDQVSGWGGETFELTLER